MLFQDVSRCRTPERQRPLMVRSRLNKLTWGDETYMSCIIYLYPNAVGTVLLYAYATPCAFGCEFAMESAGIRRQSNRL